MQGILILADGCLSMRGVIFNEEERIASFLRGEEMRAPEEDAGAEVESAVSTDQPQTPMRRCSSR